MEYTRFTAVKAEEVQAEEVRAGKVLAGVLGGLGTAVSLSKAADYTLTEAEKTLYIGVTLTAASKTVTLGLPEGAVCLLVNEGGTNAFTVKNVSGDSGTSVAAGKAYLVRASRTENGSKLTLLNDGT